MYDSKSNIYAMYLHTCAFLNIFKYKISIISKFQINSKKKVNS